jgi:hypothetical protein
MSAVHEYVHPPDCRCGHGFYEHDITTKVKACSRLTCDCRQYAPEEAA